MKETRAALDGAAVTPHQDTAALPRLPENWYLLAASPALTPGTLLPVTLHDHDIVLYRATSGRLTAYAAKCAHMGCHLKHAHPDADGIRCAMHQRLIGSDGAFRRPEGTASTDLIQPTYPVQEAFGCIFVWLGQGTPTDLPLPDIADHGPVLTRYAGHYDAEIPWFSLIANGCDMEHLASVHDRALREQPVVDTPAPGRFRISYLTRVIGTALSDRITKWLSGDHIRASMTVCNGSLMLVQSAVWKPSFFLLSMCPDGSGGTRVRAAVGIAGQGGPLARLRLWLTARFFITFLAKDFEVMKGLDWHPPVHGHSFGDRTSQALYRYFAQLTEASRD